MSDSFYTQQELAQLGFAAVGTDVRLSRKCSVYGAARIHLGSNVRIDDFCVLSAGPGGIRIGSFVHLGAFSLITGAGEVVLEDFSGFSSRVSVYSSNDDYSGAALTNPTVPPQWTNVRSAPVRIGRHAIVGSGAIILPGVIVGEGAAIGALSLVRKDCEPFAVYFGSPARRIARRSRKLLDVEKALRAQLGLPGDTGGPG
jgi:dTDP-4-amino-4,6-dideoxy-D-glucose acyltransferase